MDDDAMRARFVKALEAKGITKGSWAAASVAVINPRSGKPLGNSFLRDTIMRGKGKDEYVQWVCAHYGISWDFVKFNKGPMTPLLAIEYSRAVAETEEAETISINPVKLIHAVEGLCKFLGASQQRAERLARELLGVLQGRES